MILQVTMKYSWFLFTVCLSFSWGCFVRDIYVSSIQSSDNTVCPSSPKLPFRQARRRSGNLHCENGDRGVRVDVAYVRTISCVILAVEISFCSRMMSGWLWKLKFAGLYTTRSATSPLLVQQLATSYFVNRVHPKFSRSGWGISWAFHSRQRVGLSIFVHMNTLPKWTYIAFARRLSNRKRFCLPQCFRYYVSMPSIFMILHLLSSGIE